MLHEIALFNGSFNDIPASKKLITTLNAHSYNICRKDDSFRDALLSSDLLLPDGISIVLAVQLLQGKKIRKIAGEDLFRYEMQRVNAIKGKCFFLGSSESTLKLIEAKANVEFPDLQIHVYSPPYKTTFTEQENRDMIEAVNKVEPDVLFVGMTAPKQEKWAFEHFDKLKVGHVCCVGAVFDFYAGTFRRAPLWMIRMGAEWLYRLLSEPRRMWRRYLIGNTVFIMEVLRLKINVRYYH